MSVEINISPELEADLRAEAQRRGMSLEAYAEELLTEYILKTSTASVEAGSKEDS